MFIATVIAAATALPACQASPPPAAAPSAAERSASILASTTPADGATVPGPLDNIDFHFSAPARLIEVTVSGPEGVMPLMVTAAGETDHYSIPVSDLGAGAYTVSWRASSGGQDHQGTFTFTIG